MPNFFSTANQKLFETFHGPRTVDTEFNAKVEEIKQAERNIYHLQTLLNKVPHYFHGVKDYLEVFTQVIDTSYDRNSTQFVYIDEISNIHRQLLKLYDIYTVNVYGIGQTTHDWSRNLEEVKKNIKERERLRLIHDHYDDKIESYVKRRNKHLEKHTTETSTFIEGFERVYFY